MKDFLIIEFINDSMNDEEVKSVDCIPNKWVIFDEDTGEFKTPFLSPPYTQKKCQQFHRIVKSKLDPDPTWLIYKFIIKGQADNYEDALKRLKCLKENDYVFTTDCENNDVCVAEKINKITEDIKNGKNKDIKKKKIAEILKNVSSDIDNNINLSSNSETGDDKYARIICRKVQTKSNSKKAPKSKVSDIIGYS